MDDTLADESGIPILANSDDIPVHSTPIKGTKIPLPSTRHVMRTMHEKGQPSSLCEQEISELPNIPEENFRSSHKRLNQGQKVIDDRPQEDRKPYAKCHTERERQNSGTHKDNYKSKEDEMLLAFRQSTYRRNDSRGSKIREKADKQFHEHPRSRSNSNTQFNPSNQGQGHNRYDREDNLRSHVHSKHPRSHSEYDRTSRQHSYGSEYSQKRDLRPISPNSFDRTPPRRNMETKSDKVQNEPLLPSNTNSSSDRYPNALLNYETNKSTPPRTNPAPLSDNVNDKLLPNTNTSSNVNTNAFSSYAFTTKENKNRSQRQYDRQLDLTPENNKMETDKDGSELTIVTTARLTPRTAEVSPLARRRVRAVADTNGDKTGTSLRTLSTSVKQTSYSEVETSTIQKQRQEIQLLVTELKDRDRELGDMMKSHEQQLLAWEQDRQRVNVLDQKCSQYEADLHNKSTQLHNAHVALKALKSKYTADLEEAEGNKATIARLIGETNQFKQQLKQYEDKCGMLQKTVQDLSNNVGRLQAREEELNTSLKLKEKDIMSATSQMKELSDRLRQLDTRCKECQDREREAVKERNSWKQKYEDCTSEMQSLTDAVGEKSKQVSQLEGEIQSLRHHLAVLQKDANMREKCKDEVIESMRVKQERTDSQLKNFRELYERQLRELSKLHLQLDTSKDIINKQHSLEEQQLSGSYSTRGNSRLSDRSPDRQRNNTVQTSRYRDTDIDAHNSQQHTQSSGYQTQVSVNQSELLESQSVAGTHLQFQPNRIVHSQELPAGCKSNNDYAKFDYLNVHSETLRRKERNNKEDQAYLKPEISPKNVRYKLTDKNNAMNSHEICAKRLVFDSEGAIGDHTHSPPRGDKSQTSSKPVQSELGCLPKQINEPQLNTAAGSPPRKGGYVIEQPETKVVSQEIGNQATGDSDRVDNIDQTQGKDQRPYSEAYVFENRLCSFLEDIDDLDDSIWDEKGNISKVIPEVEASPASKLQKLLLESRMMIQSLEKTAESPTTKQVVKSETTDNQREQTNTDK